jgi:hypothetical protein
MCLHIRLAKSFLLLTLCIAAHASAKQSFAADFKGDPAPLYLTLPMLELPYNVTQGYRVPGMSQSLMISNSASYASHAAVDYVFSPLGWVAQGFGLVGWEMLFTYLPGGGGWVHEEWHRAVLGRRGIDSFDDIYYMKIGASTVSVSHVKDEDLVKLKTEHNDEMVRLMEAGNEANIEQTRVMRRDSFFSGRSTKHDRIGWLMNLLNESLYIQMCTTSEADTMTDDFNKKETTIKERDFTGLDFTAWIYDLHRPNDPYAARGVHPSGTGYDRYIKHSDLSDSELKYLRRSWRLSLLNLVSPQLLGVDRFIATNPVTDDPFFINGTLFHHLTSFGWDIGADIFTVQNRQKFEFIFHGYSNEKHFFPGLECTLYRMQFSAADNTFYLTARILFFLQPKDGLFHESTPKPGGLAGLGIAYPIIDKLELYTDVSVKSYGWVAGTVYLSPVAEVKSGLTFIL